MLQLKAFLQLARPANIVTAISDIWAGAAIAGFFASPYARPFSLVPVVCLSIATVGLYGGGVVFNDVFDAELDQVERPERPIPGGRVSRAGAAVWGIILLLAGILAGFAAGLLSGFIALAIATAALLYDKFTKPDPFLGPLNMGICRGLNLLLGISIVPAAVHQWWPLGIVPVIYIAAVTLISRGEVHGGKKKTLSFAAILYTAVMIVILLFAYANNRLLSTLPFLAFFAVLILPPLRNAFKDPSGYNVGKAVKAGVIALIVMNAAWAAAFSSGIVALIILALLPVSFLLAKLFAVT